MSEATAKTPQIVLELQELKTLTREVADKLRAQDEVLRQYGLRLPGGVTQTLSQIIKEIAALEQNVAGESRELTQLRSLAATGALVNSSLDVDEVLMRAMDNVITMAGAERGFIILKRESTGDIEFRIVRDTTNTASKSQDNPQVSMNIINDVLNSGNPMLSDNAYKDPRMQDHMSVAQFVLRSVICVPLTQRTRTIGALYVDNRLRAGVFTHRELNLLTAFANQAAVAIENARLFEKIQVSLLEITEIKDLMDNVFASIGSGVITTNAAQTVITINRAAEALLSLDNMKVIGKPLLRVLPHIDSGEADVESRLIEALRGGRADSIQITLDLPLREEPSILSLKFSPLQDDNGNTQGATLVLDDITEQTERDAMLTILQNYLPPGMMKHLDRIARIDLGGERRDVTCLFIETRPINSFPPTLVPEELMHQINHYLTVATEVIHAHEGVIDKYMGSEVMVLFNTQLNPQPDHAARAMRVALAMRQAFINDYAARGIAPDPHYYRIGVHTGVATLGNVGSIYRRNFTAIGDTINLSKRLQENATSGQIIISEETWAHARVTVNDIHVQERDAIQVKGRQQSTRIFEIS